MRSSSFVIVAVVAAVLIAATALWRELTLEHLVLITAECRQEQDICVRGCEHDHDEELSRINIARGQEFIEHGQRSAECSAHVTTAQQCHRDEDARDAQALSQLDARKAAADNARDTCIQNCQNLAEQCSRGGRVPSGPQQGGGGVSVDIACIDAPNAPCFQKVDKICTRISGVCENCKLTLCGDRTWTFTGNSLQDAALVATKGGTPTRTLASSTSKGNSAALVIPRDLKLESGEELGVQFHFGGTPGKSVTLQRNQ